MPHSTVDDEHSSSTTAQPTQDQEAAAEGPRSSRPLVNGGSPTPQRPRSDREYLSTESTSNGVQNPQYATYPAPPRPPRPQVATLHSPPQSTAANTSATQPHRALFVEIYPAGSGQDSQKCHGYIASDLKPACAELIDLNSLKAPAKTTNLSSGDSSDASEASTVAGIDKDGKGKGKGRCEDDRKSKKKDADEDDNNDKGMRKDKPRPDASRTDVPPPDKARPAAPRPGTPLSDVPDKDPSENPQFTRQYVREYFGQPVVAQPYLKGLKRVHSDFKGEQRVQPNFNGKKRVYFKDQETVKQPAPSSPWDAPTSLDRKSKKRTYFQGQETVKKLVPSSPWVGLASVPQKTWDLDRYPSPDESPARASSSADYPVCDDGDCDGFYYGPAHNSSTMRLRYSNEEEEHLTNFERIMQHNVMAVAGEVAYIGASVHNMENTMRRWEDASNARDNGIFPPPYRGQLPPSAIPHDVLPAPPAGMSVEQQRLRGSEAPAGPPDAQHSSRRPSYQPMTPSPRSSQVGSNYQQTTEGTTPTDDGAGHRISQTTTTTTTRTDDGAGHRIPQTTTTDDGAGRRGPQNNEEPGPGPLGIAGNMIFGLVATAWICMTVMSCRR
ncbi:hypothetical protein CGLO_06896 [Colletotrichum gloeosporioides Cg-14]|uniref:Uncharacterized protein n=1 Tax=Colletotrichum gloeosporioides (strain Cg-14) TaxID=1237896 RepID=T0LNV0_COLGC|nr:hypothetical protein CGLO_06896 [Colletotrichum gloeosporioides Cg-14]